MAVQVDEARTDDQARDVDDRASRRRVESGADGAHDAVGDEDVGDGVESRSRIDDTAAAQKGLHALVSSSRTYRAAR